MDATFTTDSDLGETKDGQPLTEFNGEPVTILRELGDDERDAEVGPMYEVRSKGGVTFDAWGYELYPEPASETLIWTGEEWIKK